MKHSSESKTAPLIWLAVGTFTIGTERIMISGLLPQISADLKVSASAAGQMVTVFAMAYAINSPILTALSGRINRCTLLL